MIATVATNKKVREILKTLREGSLIPRPEFQRRLVWVNKDKEKFIDTVLRGFPFPEIYLCNGDVDTETGEGTQLLVDGLQRVSTLNEYFSGTDGLSYVLNAPYKELHPSDKERFLEYNVVVRDLGKISNEQIIEVFRRLNSTQYTLRDMEVNNAIYNGALKKFCEDTAEMDFFENSRLFSATDRKRMGDVSFCLTLIGTMILGYFNRDDEHERLLSQNNEFFPSEGEYRQRIVRVLDFIDECGFDYRSRIWKKADFLTAFVEIDNILQEKPHGLMPTSVLLGLMAFYEDVDANKESEVENRLSGLYYKAALQASNDRLNRIRRGLIVGGILRERPPSEILSGLAGLGLISAA